MSYTGFRGGLEHLKIETRLIDESGVIGVPSIFNVIRSAVAVRMLTTLYLTCEEHHDGRLLFFSVLFGVVSCLYVF
jgi:hypothetical protein